MTILEVITIDVVLSRALHILSWTQVLHLLSGQVCR